MVRYWKIAPGDHGFAWVEQRDHDCIAVGWNETGNLGRYKSPEAIRKRFEQVKRRGIWDESTRPRQLIQFYQDVKLGDGVLASSGDRIHGIGVVTGKYQFDDQLFYYHTKPVTWSRRFWEPVIAEELHIPDRIVDRIRRPTIIELLEEDWNLIERALSRFRTPFEGFTSFEGILRAPETEQEVIILFSKLSQYLGMRIERVGTRFPDALLRVKRGRHWMSEEAEFEIRSSDFVKHRHDVKRCGLVICWKDDLTRGPTGLEIIELRKELREMV